MKRPFTLAPDTISTNTVEALSQLLDLARSGEIIGIAFTCMLKQRKFFVNTAGEAHRNPMFARALVAVLDDSLSNRIHNRGDSQ